MTRTDGLARRGGAFWDSVIESYALDPIESALAREVAVTLDLLDRLRRQVRRDGLTVAGSMRQKRLHPAVAAMATTQTVVDRLLTQLRSRLKADTDEWDRLVDELSTPTWTAGHPAEDTSTTTHDPRGLS